MKKKKENFKEKILKQKIESLKTELNMYKKVLIKYAFVETCTASVYFEDLFHTALSMGFDAIEDSKKSKKQKDKLKTELLGFYSDESILEANYEHYERLVGWAKCTLNNLNDKIKEKIIDDSIRLQDTWSQQFAKNDKIFKKLEKK